MDAPDGPAPEPATHLLRCHTCGRTVMCSADEVLAFVRGGWPRCCGETMAVFVEAARPDPPPK